MTAVQGTNDSSIASKLSSAEGGYYKDQYLKYFCCKKQQRSPLIKRGYYIRFKAMECLFLSWFNLIDDLDLGGYQIISLGAGFDTSYFRLKQEGRLSQCKKYIEVDYPDVMQRKCICITQQEALMQCFEVGDYCCAVPEIAFHRGNYFLLGINLNDIEKLESSFTDAKLDFSLPTLIFSECAITYMDAKRSDSLISWAKNKLPNSVFSVYEQVYPLDGFGLIMCNHFQNIGSPLKSVLSYPDLESQRLRFLQLGWPVCSVLGADSIWASLPKEEKDRISSLELFDEYETWHQKCYHYVLTWACQGLLLGCTSFRHAEISFAMKQVACKADQGWSKRNIASQMQRYGHQIVKLTDEVFLLFGGFGPKQRKHQRLTGASCGNMRNGSLCDVAVKDDQNILGARMHHSMMKLSDGTVVVYGGRSAPQKPYKVTALLQRFEDHSQKGISIGRTKTNKAKLCFNCEALDEKGMQPESRWRHTANRVTLNGIELMFVFGGCTAEKTATDDCQMLNTKNWTWLQVPWEQNTPSPRHSHSSVIDCAHRVVISCGLSAEEVALNSIHAFDASSRSWSVVPVRGVLPRYSHTSHIYEQKLFLIGGVCSSGSVLPYIACIDLQELSAVEISMPGQDPDYPVLLHNHCSILDEHHVAIFGGGGNCFSFGTHFNKHTLYIDLKSFMC